MGVTARAALLACLLALLVAPPASAQSDQIAPPGNAGVDEYLETIPDPRGNRPSGAARRGGGRRGAVVDSRTRSRLRAMGEDGEAAAALADSTAPAANRPPVPRGGVPAADLSRAGEGTGPLGSVTSRALGSDASGMGALLPALLAVTFAGAMAVLLLRRRRRTV